MEIQAIKALLIKPGELMLKGDNRIFFENKLRNNIKTVLKSICTYEFTQESGRYYIVIKDSSYTEKEIAIMLCKVFGIVAVSIAYRIDSNEQYLYEFLTTICKQAYNESPFESFRVTTKRADKDFYMQSTDVSKKAGGVILSAIPEIKVDLHNPQIIFNIEIRKKHMYIYYEELKANGGMPVGSSGKALLMLSGGIDSPVAGYMMAKRGLMLETVYFHSEPYTSEKAKEKVIDLAKIIKPYTLLEKLHIVHFTKPQLEIYEKCPHDELTIIMRRVMMYITNEIAKKTGCLGIITGESLGQVASQTIESLTVTDEASELLVFRPLIGMDKNEIIEIARKIDTFETSILPYEDCCTIFVARHPKTKPILNRIKESEKVLNIDEIVKNCIENLEVVSI
ncbi:MAG: tRNA uracil 4-sulfurtransferase ThiI [Clostridia bacterium]|jgi:thiamine biosynthesis protein ThiI